MSNSLPLARPRASMLVLASFIAFAATSASAQTIPPEEITPEMQQAFNEARPFCEDDAARFCRGVIPGGGRIVKCMFEHIEDLSPACRQKIQEVIPQ